MAKPNKAVGSATRNMVDRYKGRPLDEALKDVFERVQNGELTPEKGVEMVNELRNQS
jgi:hypothetical protein